MYNNPSDQVLISSSRAEKNTSNQTSDLNQLDFSRLMTYNLKATTRTLSFCFIKAFLDGLWIYKWVPLDSIV